VQGGNAAAARAKGRTRWLAFACGVSLALVMVCVVTASARAALPVQLLPPSFYGGIDGYHASAEIGQPFTCEPGSWQSDSPVTIAIQWHRGTTVVGTGETYHLQAADIGGGLSCSVTATNADGSVTWASYGPPGSGVTLPATSIVSSDRLGRITVSLRCSLTDRPCQDNVSLSIGKRIVAITAIRLDASAHAQVVLSLTRYGRATLRAHPLSEGLLSVRATGKDGLWRDEKPVAIAGYVLANPA
jgi:hypothetical protein